MTETMTFGGLWIGFDERVLRPRPWTLEQSLWAVELAGSVPDGPLLELCAGVGHIGLAAADRLERELVLVDVDPHACELAGLNAKAAGLVVEIRTGAVDQVLTAQEVFPLILADPPWVRSDGTGRFSDDPLTAIDGGDDGLDIARTCVRVIGAHLDPRGAAVLQLGDLAQAAVLGEHLGQHPEIGLRVGEVREPAGDGVLVMLTR